MSPSPFSDGTGASRAPLDGSRDREPDSAARQIAALTAELQQREALIETLTAQLEQAAEQLDRLHRSGADRQLRASASPGGGVLPGELFEQQAALLERLESVLGEWDDLQGAALLRRLDARLEKLIELLRGDVREEAPSAAAESDRPADAAPTNADTPPATDAAGAGGEPPPADDPWELPPPPAPIGEEEQNVEVLRGGLIARDEYIAALIRELRCRRPTTPINWEALQNCPAELEQRLRALEHQMQTEVQREELALSLERARLARERAELDRIRARLEREIRQLGQAKEVLPADDEEQPRSSTWRSLFGKRT